MCHLNKVINTYSVNEFHGVWHELWLRSLPLRKTLNLIPVIFGNSVHVELIFHPGSTSFYNFTQMVFWIYRRQAISLLLDRNLNQWWNRDVKFKCIKRLTKVVIACENVSHYVPLLVMMCRVLCHYHICYLKIRQICSLKLLFYEYFNNMEREIDHYVSIK